MHQLELMRITDDGEVTFTSRREKERRQRITPRSSRCMGITGSPVNGRFLFCSYYDRYFSRGEVKDLAAGIASVILGLGIKTNDVVSGHSFGDCNLRCCLCCTNSRVHGTGMGSEVRRLDSKLLVCDQDNLPTAVQVARECDIRNIIDDDSSSCKSLLQQPRAG